MKYFGTDGIRGQVGSEYINSIFFQKLGRAIVLYLNQKYKNEKITIILGRDTRSSGAALEESFTTGARDAGASIETAGIAPTPAVSCATGRAFVHLRAVFTASHNLSIDNGIKFFNAQGRKISAKDEITIESILDKELTIRTEQKIILPPLYANISNYFQLVESLLPKNFLNGIKIVADLANGAAVTTAPAVLQHYGATIFLLGDKPNGLNINDNTGSEHPHTMTQAVKTYGAIVGMAFDGDGDRLVLCDEFGSILKGEEIMAIVGIYALSNNLLQSNTWITTHQSNLALDRVLENYRGKVERVATGDRNIIYKMLEKNSNFGGEASGHFIFHNQLPTSDGLIAALYVINVMIQSDKTLSQLRKSIELYPQLNQNLSVSTIQPLRKMLRTQAIIRSRQMQIDTTGRILVRYSGTEKKLRFLVEGPCVAENKCWMKALQVAARLDLNLTI